MTNFERQMKSLHADSYSLTNDIAAIYDKANALVFEVLQYRGYCSFADTYQAIVSEYQVQMKGRMARH